MGTLRWAGYQASTDIYVILHNALTGLFEKYSSLRFIHGNQTLLELSWHCVFRLKKKKRNLSYATKGASSYYNKNENNGQEDDNADGGDASGNKHRGDNI